MNPFILPPLQGPVRERPWGSRIQLPPESPNLLDTIPKQLLPAVEKNYITGGKKRISIWEAEPRFEDTIESLERQQRKLRALIGGREHESRYRILWQHQEEKVIIECQTEAATVSESAKQRARYSQRARNFEARGHVLHVEALMRGYIRKAEEDARRHIEALEATASLKGLQHKALREAESVESFLHSLCDVYNFEKCVAQGSFHPSKIFKPVTPLILSRNTGTGYYNGGLDLLMDYTVCDDEYEARINVQEEERLSRLELYWKHSAVANIWAKEFGARRVLRQLFEWGRCQVRLDALLILQRWWRMLRVTPWSIRRKCATRDCFRRKRWEMTSSDYRALLSRMQKDQSPLGGSPSIPHVRQSIASLERAAEMCHQWVYDYFMYTLMNRAAQFYGLVQHDLRIHSVDGHYEQGEDDEDGPPLPLPFSMLRMPYRVFVRMQPKQPYPSWRVNRWVEGSTTLMQLQKRFVEEEMCRRSRLHEKEAYGADTLRLFQSVLNKGDWPWRSFCTAMHFITHDESVVRGLVVESERDARATLLVAEVSEVSRFVVLEDERLYILQEEAKARETIVNRERGELDRLTEGEWRWANLCRTRGRFAASCGSIVRWERERDRGFGSKHVSLDSLALIITRFFRRCQRRRRLDATRLRGAAEETRVREAAFAMVGQLESLIEEDKLLVSQYTTQFGTTVTGILSPVAAMRSVNPILAASGTEEELPYINLSVALFSEWFDAQARGPMERNYKDIVARFIATHKDLYRDMQRLFYVIRRVREGVAKAERGERMLLQGSEVCINVAAYELSVCEERERLELTKETEDTYQNMCEHIELIGALTWCTTLRTELRPVAFPTTGTIRVKSEATKALLPLPLYTTSVNRLLCREEVTRVRIAVEELREYKACLYSVYCILREGIIREEAGQCRLLCASVDGCFPNNLPIAQFEVLKAEEFCARIPIEEEALNSYGSLILRCVSEYAASTLFKRFLQGFVKFSSEAQFFDRQLQVMLFQRVSFLGSKLRELVAMETCARSRLEFYEGLHWNELQEGYAGV